MRDWGETLKLFFSRLTRPERLLHLTDFEKLTDCLAVHKRRDMLVEMTSRIIQHGSLRRRVIVFVRME